MEKPTKRKAFNFLRSYFDVVNELEKDTDKLNFLMSIINKQFLDEDPKDLTFLVNLCYSSQKHSIESSVKGWKRASNTDMYGNPLTDPSTPLGTNPLTNPSTPLGTNPLTNPKEEEEEEEVKEKEEEEVKEILNPINWDILLSYFNKATKKKSRSIPEKVKKAFLARLKEGYTKEDISLAIRNCYNDSYHIETKHKYLTLEFISRADKMDKFCNIEGVNTSKTTNQKLMTYDN